MADWVYKTLEGIARGAVKAQGVQVKVIGAANIPSSGGVVLAPNHTSYIDFVYVGLAARAAHRKARYLLKKEATTSPIMQYLVRECKAVPVDRDAGGEAYSVAVERLSEGEAVVVYPEATHSRSFEVKDCKLGAARMAHEAQVPIVPIAIWGSQRQWSKDLPRAMGRHKFPVEIRVGTPIAASEDSAAVTAQLRQTLQELVDEIHQGWTPYPAGAPWVPARLGGGAPTPDEATKLDDADRAARQAKKH